MLQRSTYTALMLLLGLSPVAADAVSNVITGRVVEVIDGDSFILEHDGQRLRVELWGVDAPELGNESKPAQLYAQAAKDFVAGFIADKQVHVIRLGQRNGAILGSIKLGRQSINAQLVYRGLAWHDDIHHPYIRQLYGVAMDPHIQRLVQLERDARMNRRGLWSQINPVAPWDY